MSTLETLIRAAIYLETQGCPKSNGYYKCRLSKTDAAGLLAEMSEREMVPTTEPALDPSWLGEGERLVAFVQDVMVVEVDGDEGSTFVVTI